MIPLSLPEYLEYIGTIISFTFIFVFFSFLLTTHDLRVRLYGKVRAYLFNIYTTAYFEISKMASRQACNLLDRLLLPPKDEQRLFQGGYFSSARLARAAMLAMWYLLLASAIFDLAFDTRQNPPNAARSVFDWHDEEAFQFPLTYFSISHLIVSDIFSLTIPVVIFITTWRLNNPVLAGIAGILILLFAANAGNLCPYLNISQDAICYDAAQHNFLNSIFNFSVHGVYQRTAFPGTIMVLLAFLTMSRGLNPIVSIITISILIYVQQFGLLTIFNDNFSYRFRDFIMIGGTDDLSSLGMVKSTRNALILAFVLVNAGLDVVSSSISRYLFWIMRETSTIKRYLALLIKDIIVALVLLVAIPLGLIIAGFLADLIFPGRFADSLGKAFTSEVIALTQLDGDIRRTWILLMIVTSLLPSLLHLTLLIFEISAKLFEPVIRKFVFAGDYLLAEQETMVLGARISATERMFFLFGFFISTIAVVLAYFINRI